MGNFTILGRDEHLIKRLTELLKSHDSGGSYRVAALLAKGRKIIDVTFNQYPIYRGGKNDWKGLGTHAEYSILSKNHECRNMTMYIIVISRDDTLSNSMPCERCWNAIIETSNVRKIVYIYDNKIISVLKKDMIKKYPRKLD